MAQAREYDLVVFGASGFTGIKVAEELARVLKDKQLYHVKWAIAGRSLEKLQTVIDHVRATVGAPDVERVGVIVADVKDETSLHQMARQAKVLLNCVGPFRFFGEPVVAACVEEGTHYVDITGEPEFMERTELKYHERAQDKDVTIVSACGFDSVPADLGSLESIRLLKEEATKLFPGINPEEVVPHSLRGGQKGIGAHYATWESAVHGFASAASLARIRKQIYQTRPLTISTPGPSMKRYRGRFHDKSLNRYGIPFPGSDASVVRRSQRNLVEQDKDAYQPFQYGAYLTVESRLWFNVLSFYGLIFQLLARFRVGRWLLLRFPRLFSKGIFSHRGPTEEQMKHTAFEMTFVSKGYSPRTAAAARRDKSIQPDLSITTRLVGPEPGYIATPKFIVNGALVLLNSKKGIPRGVLTPGSAFLHTDYMEEVKKMGIEYNIVKPVSRSDAARV